MIGGIPHNGKGPAMVDTHWIGHERHIGRTYTQEMERCNDFPVKCGICDWRGTFFEAHPTTAKSKCPKCGRECIELVSELSKAIAANFNQWFHGVTQGNSVG